MLLGYLGAQPPEGIYVIAGRMLTVCYFAYFLILLPLLSRIETPRPVPNSIADDVLAKTGSRSAPMVSTVIALMVAGGLFAGSAQQCAGPPRTPMPPSQKWSFSGPFGKYDRGALQRGLKIYKEVCSACHSLNYIAFRNLADPGGPGLFRGAGRGLCVRIQDQGRPERPGRNVRAARPAGRLLPPAVSQRAGGARGQWRRVASGPVADHQGALL